MAYPGPHLQPRHKSISYQYTLCKDLKHHLYLYFVVIEYQRHLYLYFVVIEYQYTQGKDLKRHL